MAKALPMAAPSARTLTSPGALEPLCATVPEGMRDKGEAMPEHVQHG
jgi:hypothetical protein